jgi:uncharacterized protein (TIGR02118 family)
MSPIPVKIIYTVRKLPALSWDEFVSHWNTTHADLAQLMPGLRGYSINIGSVEQRGSRPFDGYAMLRFDSREAAKQAWATPEGVATAQDGTLFMEHPAALMVTERNVIPGGRS